MAKGKKPSRWDTVPFRAHRYSKSLEDRFRVMMKAHLAYEMRLFTTSFEYLEMCDIPESFIRDVLDSFEAEHRSDDKAACVGLQHHINRIVSLRRKDVKPQAKPTSVSPIAGVSSHDD